jgi:hypothetical protein
VATLVLSSETLLEVPKVLPVAQVRIALQLAHRVTSQPVSQPISRPPPRPISQPTFRPKRNQPSRLDS